MIGECIRQGSPFGVVLIRRGAEVGGPAITYNVGTSAYVTQIEQLPDRRLNIQAVGHQRFKIQSVQDDKPYPIGIIEDDPIGGENDPQIEAAAARLLPWLRTYLALLHKVGATRMLPDRLPQDSQALAFFTAILLPLRLDEKQELLECDTILTLLDRQLLLMKREMMLLESVLLHEPPRRDLGTPFSEN